MGFKHVSWLVFFLRFYDLGFHWPDKKMQFFFWLEVRWPDFIDFVFKWWMDCNALIYISSSFFYLILRPSLKLNTTHHLDGNVENRFIKSFFSVVLSYTSPCVGHMEAKSPAHCLHLNCEIMIYSAFSLNGQWINYDILM